MRLTAWLCAALFAVGCMDEGEKRDRPKPEAKPSGTEGEGATAKSDKEAVKPATPPAAKMTSADYLKKFEACNADMKDAAKLAACYTDDAMAAIVDAPGMMFTGGKAIVEGLFGRWHAAMPDFTPTPQLVLVNGNQLVAFMQATGTNSGPLMGMPASNKKVGMLGARYVVFADDGRMKEDWHVADMTTILHQTGHLKGVKLPMPPRVDMKPVMEKPEMVVATDSKIEADNVAVVTKLDDAYAKGDAKAVGELLTDDFVYRDNTMAGEMKGKDSSVKMLEAMNKAWSDKKWESKARFGAGDYVASVGTFTATNTGDMPMMKLKKTGKTTTTTMVSIFHLTGGKVDSMWGFSNGYAWYVQMGIITPPKMPEGGEAPAEAPKGK